MIDERTAELLAERLVRRTEQANTYFLMKMGSSIKKIKQLKPNEAKQLIQMLKYGSEYDDIVRQIAEYTNLNVNEIDEIFADYARKDQQFYKKFYDYRNIPYVPFDENTALKMQTRALSNVVKNELYNFSRINVLGYSIKDADGVVRFTGLRETYNRVLDEAMVNISQGVETFNSAMTRIMKDIGGSGLKTLDFESGRSIRLDSMVRMHLQSRLRQLHNENQKIIGSEFDFDGWEISVHPFPAPDHEEAQGRQFRIDEFEKLQTEGVATDYTGKEIDMHLELKNGDSAVSFRPISEYNCYHKPFAIVLGVSKPEYSDKELQQIIDDNNKGFEYEGKHYTNYEGTQLQRALERKIREQKDIQILAKTSDTKELISEAQTKITQLTNKYKELNKISGLKPKMERMRVSSYKRTKVK